MKISCVMCVYNTAATHLREAIDSILNQTMTDFELIIVDDGSTDPTVKETISSYTDPRIHYLYQPNGGISAARNLGNAHAKGTYIAVMDSDDIALPNRFEVESAFLDAHPDISGVGSFLELFPNRETWTFPENPCLLDCLIGSPLAHGTSLYRRNDFETHALTYNTNLKISVDFDLWCRAMMKGLKFHTLPQILLYYRRDNQGVTAKCKNDYPTTTAQIKEKVMTFLTADNVDYRQKLEAVLHPILRRKITFCGLPLLKINAKNNRKKYLLFGFLPICSICDQKHPVPGDE